ncbi:MAG: hypothetical protein RIR51_1697, partial [Bacteroidota bacterium]
MSKNWLKLLLFLISYIFIAQNSYAQIVQLDSIQKDKPADLKTTVAYSAKDSTILEADSQIVQLYGNAKVIYGDIALEANYIRLDYAKNEVYATGTYDSVSKKEIGLPVFTQGEDKYDAKVIRYNFKTEKAIIKEIVTTQGDGFVQGENVKKDPEDNLYIRDAIYTTCNLEQPHFNIRARKIKMV